MSTPTYVRRAARPIDNYTLVPNALIRDRRLSDHARMLAIWLLSHDASFKFDAAAMATAMGTGRDRTRASLRELEGVGYLTRARIHKNGRLVGIEYTLNDFPQVTASDGFSGDSPDQGEQQKPDTQGRIPRAGYPGPENPSPYKKTKYEEDQLEEDQEEHPSPDGDGVTDDGGLFPAKSPAQTRLDSERALTHEFETQFWPAYPRKVGKLAAAAAFMRARRRGVELAQLVAGVKAYAKAVQDKEARFIAHAATWLNAGRWMDEETTTAERAAANGYRAYQDSDYWSTA